MSAHNRQTTFLALLAGASLAVGLLLLTPAASADTPLPGQIVVDPDNPRWFRYHEGGPFFLAGPGDPEDFLYRGRRNRDGTRKGDQMRLIQKLAKSGANSIYLQAVRSHGGDGTSTHNPFIDNDPRKGLNEAVLDQWEEWFTEMDRHGITIFFIFYDDSSRIWDTGDRVSEEEREFFHALVDRFEHHKHLIWVVGEEYEERYTWRRASQLAQEIRAADDHGHPVSIHKRPGVNFREFAGDPKLDQYAVQIYFPSARQLHDDMVGAFHKAAGRYNLNMAEAAEWGRGDEARRKLWAVAMAGAYVMVYQMDIDYTSMSDLKDCGRLVRFMESTDFDRMAPRDDLGAADTEYVLARPGVSYIVYSSHAGEGMGLRELEAGRYRLRWLDLQSGREAVNEVVVGAGGSAHLLPKPSEIGHEVAVYVRHLDPSPERLAARLPVMERLGTNERGRPITVASAASTLARPSAPVARSTAPSPDHDRGATRLASNRPEPAPPVEKRRSEPARLGHDHDRMLFTDGFDRGDSEHVGNDWHEIESVSQLAAREGRLTFDARDDALRPMAQRRFASRRDGVLVWSFDLNFERTGGERDYSFWMQLGEGSKMVAHQPGQRGVAVNLKWGGPGNGLAGHEGLGYVVDGRVRQIATVSGGHTVTVRADLDRRTYDIEVGGVFVEAVPFDDDVSIDTVRFFADNLNLANFAYREIDNVMISALDAPDATEVAEASAATASPGL